LPINYNYFLQSAIYQSIDEDLAEFLHSRGFMAENRSFKAFSFSRLRGKYKLDQPNNRIVFYDSLRFIICSPINEFCESLVNKLLTRGTIKVGNELLEIEKIMAQKPTVNNTQILVNTLSPVVAYSTFLRPEGGKYTCYFGPDEPDYNRLISENLKKKYQAIYNQSVSGDVTVNSLGLQKLTVASYKGTVIKGYSGKLRLRGPQALLQLAVDYGLGSKNSQGFGCLKLIEERG